MVYKEDIKILRENIKVGDYNWVNMNSTNCFSFGLNIDYPYTLLESYKKHYLNLYKVGTISGIKEIYTKEKLEQTLFSDLDLLGIDIKKINYDEELLDYEWKIAMYGTDVYYDYALGKIIDYHFIKQNPNNKFWTHKLGFSGSISNKDDNNKLITNPSEFYFEESKDIFNDLFSFEYIGCYKLKKK